MSFSEFKMCTRTLVSLFICLLLLDHLKANYARKTNWLHNTTQFTESIPMWINTHTRSYKQAHQIVHCPLDAKCVSKYPKKNQHLQIKSVSTQKPMCVKIGRGIRAIKTNTNWKECEREKRRTYTRVTHDMDDFDDVQKKHTKWVSIRDTIRDTSRYDTIYVFADKKRAHTKKQNMKN